MAEFQIITDYRLDNNQSTPWILNDDTLITTAVGTLGSLGSDQGIQLSLQTEVLKQQVADIEKLQSLVAKFSDANFLRFSVDQATSTIKITSSNGTQVSWDIGSIADSFPARTIPAVTTDPKIQSLIDFYNGIKQVYESIDLTFPLSPNFYRVTYKYSPTDPFDQVVISTDPPGFDSTENKYYVVDRNRNIYYFTGRPVVEPFVVPASATEYQRWLLDAAVARSNQIDALFTQYGMSDDWFIQQGLTPIQGDKVLWQVATTNGAMFLGDLPVPTSNVFLETTVGRVVKDAFGIYYRIKTPFAIVGGLPVYATFEAVTPISSLTKLLKIAPSYETLRDIRSRFSEKALQITQRNASQQLLVNSLLVSYNLYFDAAANVLKALNDLQSRLAGNV